MSGRPNPQWILTDPDATEGLLSAVAESGAAAKLASGHLGLGFREVQVSVIEDDPQRRPKGVPGAFALGSTASGELLGPSGDLARRLVEEMTRYADVQLVSHPAHRGAARRYPRASRALPRASASHAAPEAATRGEPAPDHGSRSSLQEVPVRGQPVQPGVLERPDRPAVKQLLQLRAQLANGHIRPTRPSARGPDLDHGLPEHEDLYGPDGRERHERTAAEHDHHVPRMLEAVLVDPNLQTDLGMRLHREIEEILSSAR